MTNSGPDHVFNEDLNADPAKTLMFLQSHALTVCPGKGLKLGLTQAMSLSLCQALTLSLIKALTLLPAQSRTLYLTKALMLVSVRA